MRFETHRRWIVAHSGSTTIHTAPRCPGLYCDSLLWWCSLRQLKSFTSNPSVNNAQKLARSLVTSFKKIEGHKKLAKWALRQKIYDIKKKWSFLPAFVIPAMNCVPYVFSWGHRFFCLWTSRNVSKLENRGLLELNFQVGHLMIFDNAASTSTETLQNVSKLLWWAKRLKK